MGCFEGEYEFKLKENAQPIAHAPRKVPQALTNKLKMKLDDMEKNGIIVKTNEYSEWVHHLVTVEKKDETKSLRLCLDPKELNENMADEHTHIPTLEELSTKLSHKKYFTILDLRDGFWHVKLTPESQKLCTFATPFGNYRFTRMPFGVKCGPSVFQRKNFENFGDIENVLIYFDDICVSGRTKKEHDEVLLKVLQRAREKNVRFNPNKFQFAMTEVKYLGHIFSHNQIKPDPDRLTAIEKMGRPKNKKDLQTFLGVINDMRKFIPNLSDKTASMRELLKKNSVFVWTEVHDVEMDKIREEIMKSNILAPFDETKATAIQCDASQHGLGCCLLQDGKPISFASRSLNDAEKNYSQIEKEMLSILFACTKFHYYTYGRQIKVINDHKPLLGIMKKDIHKIPSAKLQRMKLKLLNYDIKLEFAPGKTIQLADYLSRYEQIIETKEDKSMSHAVLSINVSDERVNELQKETENDENLKEIINYCLNGWPINKKHCPSHLKYYYRFKDDIILENKLLFYNDRIIIPTKMRKIILDKLHEPHFGITKTLQRARMSVFWPNITNEIENLVSNCATCQINAPNKRNEPLIPHEIPNKPFVKIGCDILEHEGRDYLAVSDYYSKWIELMKLNGKTAKEINMKLMQIFATHGYPSIIIADNVPFGSFECVEFAKNKDVKIINSSPRYPKSNGMAERTVQICKHMLKKSRNEEELLKSLLAYRTTPVKYLNYSPSQLLYNRQLRNDLPMHNKKFEPKICHDVESQLKLKQSKMKECYDRTSRQGCTFVDSQNILFKNNNKWQPGQILNKHENPRSFVIQSEGRTYRRNTQHIRPHSISITNDKRTQSNGRENVIEPKVTRSGRKY